MKFLLYIYIYKFNFEEHYLDIGRLIPTLMLIIGWGYQPERIQAGIYLLFYTLFVSLPLLMEIYNGIF
ncbi:unnamed protein product [Trichogramma brassicae]|uniref:NADH-ubiquinone oxidoreductase chain 4 n=1 Tax=Trichogramma brassicae TaxID=86971 RepID=A0A6H5HY36_9HYME|nr:unnamed protein product [Trichogramma brassicae]